MLNKRLPILIDIGANLTDPMFRGIYRGARKHVDDFEHMLNRAKENGIGAIIITGGSLSDSMEALDLAKQYKNLYSTVGCHPTRCNELEQHPNGPMDYLEKMKQLALNNRSKVVSMGEMGLDYDRTSFCSEDTQRLYFEKQLEIADCVGLPLFLHCRAAWSDFFDIMERNRAKWFNLGAVLHSFDGNREDLKRALEMGLYIGINGCSLKKQENLDVIKDIPDDKLLIETDCPWCEIKRSHVSYKCISTHFNRSKNATDIKLPVKDRNEPALLINILEAISNVREVDSEKLAKKLLENTLNLFNGISLEDTQI